jgi:unsaturated rhamnogalacturonyl hydrolase
VRAWDQQARIVLRIGPLDLGYFERLLPDQPLLRELIAQLERDAAAIVRYQDKASGLWYQVLDQGGREGNYLESSASCMFVYALAKGVRRGYLPSRYLANAGQGYQGILSHFVESSGEDVSLGGTVKGAGLGGDPYRDGSYTYYIHEKVGTNDPKGVGAFLLASTEIENATTGKLGRGRTVLLDAWFNSQKRADAFGEQTYFHYKWNDQSNSGFSLLGHMFRSFGSETKMLYSAPTLANLKQADVYVIVSPDIPAKNPDPHYMTSDDAAQIVRWVKAGGVLVILENDPPNADLEHVNLLAEQFGIHYNNVLRNRVDGRKFEMGKIAIAGRGAIFHDAHAIYMKEICTITAKSPATPVLEDRGDTLMVTAKVGKGTVFATVDPWLYNEYTDGRKLPPGYDNFGAGKELVRWMLAQVPRRSRAIKSGTTSGK